MNDEPKYVRFQKVQKGHKFSKILNKNQQNLECCKIYKDIKYFEIFKIGQ